MRAAFDRLGVPVALLFMLLLSGSIGGAPVHRQEGGALVITPVSPANNSTIASSTPNITGKFTDISGTIVKDSVVVVVDSLNVTGIQGFYVTPSTVSYQPLPILHLKDGNHTVTISASDSAGNSGTVSWRFVVNSSLVSPTPPLAGISVRAVIFGIAIGAGVIGAGFAAYILYLKRSRNFTFRKYFATHPLQREYLSLYVPAIIAFLFLLVGLIYVYSTPGLPNLSPEYIGIATVFIALLTYAIDARAEKRRIRSYERAFAQFLFEMADAMRGGIDPAKAVIELSTTSNNILKKHLRIAADGIRVGRPFDQVIRSMAEPMRSPLISRYAALIADASTVGGETAAVVHRGAKDMDDFIKIEIERGQALTMPVAVLYIAYGVLLAVLFSLLSIAPSLGNLNLSLISGGAPIGGSGGGSASIASVPKLSLDTLRQRFFDLAVINSLGTGVIIGAFTEGKAKYGLLHSLALMGATALAFFFFAT